MGIWIGPFLIVCSGLFFLYSTIQEKKSLEERIIILEIKIAILLEERNKS